jgi:hypothetical protein
MSDIVLERIEGWEAAGLIDHATAEQLRAAEADRVGSDAATDAAPATRAGLVSSFFGPPLSIVEAFSYLGGAFVLAAWTALIGRLTGEAQSPTREWITVAGFALPAVVFFVIGMLLHDRTPRLRRAAGVAFALSVGAIWGGVTVNVEILTDGALPAVVGAVAALVAAVAYRWFHPSVLTEIALLGAITGLVGSSLQLLDQVLYPESQLGGFATRGIGGVALEAIAWVGCAIVIGLIALVEARTNGEAAARRATLARFWAGVIAVSGVAVAVTRTECTEIGCARVLEPWVAAVIVLIVAAVLLERAFRRESGAYVLAAALGVVIALTDLNASYFAPTTGNEVALLAEGLLLIAIAVLAERVTRRIARGRRDDRPAGGSPSTTPAPDSQSAPEPDAGAGVETASG